MTRKKFTVFRNPAQCKSSAGIPGGRGTPPALRRTGKAGKKSLDRNFALPARFGYPISPGQP
ncbi:MAG TPA: hypothetical protein VI386_07910 [Candidatus Sulfotelmatobacter sp.]